MKTNLTNDGINHYFNISIVNSYDMDEFAYKMLSQSPPQTLPCKFFEDDMLTFTYKINGLQSLSELFKGGMRFNVFVSILKHMIDYQIKLREYLIDENQIVFSNEAIFVDVVTYMPHFTILPVENYEGNLRYREWLMEAINSQALMNIDRFLYNKLLSYVHSDDFCLSGLKQILDSKHDVGYQRAVEEPVRDKKTALNREIFIEEDNQPINIKHSNKDKENLKVAVNGDKKRLKIAFLFVQILLICIIGAVWVNAELFMSNTLKVKVITCLIALSIDVLLGIKLFNPEGKRISSAENLADKAKFDQATEKRKKDKFKSVFNSKKREQQNSNQTQLLSPVNQASPFLLNKKTGVIVSIDKSVNVIGREEGESDILIDSKTVGRKHCEIARYNLSCEIVDLMSKNGTFINGQRLENNLPSPINHGDLLTIADVEFQFFAY